MNLANQRSEARRIPKHVMVVEDDAVLALSIEETLRDAGASKISVFSTTADSIDYLRQTRPDAAIIDVHLADAEDGYVLAEILSLLGPQQPRIVFSTGSPGDIPESIARLGYVLEKPYGPDQLIQALAQKPKGMLARLLS